MIDACVDPRNCLWCDAELSEQVGQPRPNIRFKRGEQLENVVTLVKYHRSSLTARKRHVDHSRWSRRGEWVGLFHRRPQALQLIAGCASGEHRFESRNDAIVCSGSVHGHPPFYDRSHDRHDFSIRQVERADARRSLRPVGEMRRCSSIWRYSRPELDPSSSLGNGPTYA